MVPLLKRQFKASKFFKILPLIVIFLVFCIHFKLNIQDFQPKIRLEAIHSVLGCIGHETPKEHVLEEGFYQVFHSSNGTFKLLKAFYDERPFYKDQNLAVVKITGLLNRVDPAVKTFCQLWFDDIDNPIVSQVHKYQSIFPKRWGLIAKEFPAYFMECYNPLAPQGKVPKSVSLVENPCDVANNQVDVTFNRMPEGEEKKMFMVCSKSHSFTEDTSKSLVEWIETMFVLGAAKVGVAPKVLHPEVKKALEYYDEQGMIELEMFPPTDANMSVMRNEVLGFNHCFYRNLYRYKFITILDFDEVIVPQNEVDKDLNEMLARVVRKGDTKKSRPPGYIFDCYAARQALFLLDNNHKGEIQPEVPTNFMFLQHVYRGANLLDNGIGPKTFQNTEKTELPHNHYSIECFQKDSRWCDVARIEEDDGKLHHYRWKCENLNEKQCNDYANNTVKDVSLWRFKDKIIENTLKSLKAIEKFSKV